MNTQASPTIALNEITSIVKAFENGRLIGQATMEGKRHFAGAMPEAETEGHESGTPEYGAFIGGYLSALPATGVTVGPDGYIVR